MNELKKLLNNCHDEIDRIIKEKQEFINLLKQNEQSDKKKIEENLKIILEKLDKAI